MLTTQRDVVHTFTHFFFHKKKNVTTSNISKNRELDPNSRRNKHRIQSCNALQLHDALTEIHKMISMMIVDSGISKDTDAEDTMHLRQFR